ncbi:hypothetical protein KEM54_005786 [Ascosphaera aggregata]|nr:hypothetical protein KEM54_005786 [Ascosphaera aggregata]
MPSLVSKEPGAPSVSSVSSSRRNSKFSLGKHRKQKSSISDAKIDLHESHAEKEARRLKSYADPNMAVNQLEPAAMALEQSTMDSLFLKQHKDLFGNPIVDPDLSNPTRHRLERPLDTIRSFEAAIEESYYTKRVSYGSRNNDQQGSTYDHRYGHTSNSDAMASTTYSH